MERELGIEVYATKSSGTGGRIRQFPEDFVVEEVLSDGSVATIGPQKILQIKGRERYLICILVKRNWDTLLAVRTIAQQLGISQERIQIAGIKDTKALTAQHISIGRTTPDMISKVKIRDMKLHPMRFSNDKIHSAELYGNRFLINIRAILGSRSKIMERMQDVKRDLEGLGGIPNFFGHQRFGTTRPITHLVGKYILLDELEKAALTFLAKPGHYEHPESRQAREQLWNTQNYEKALHYFPFRLVYERQMLKHLAKQPTDFIGAFHRLPKRLRQLFIQAYQSYLFNRFLSQRIQHELPLKKARKGEYKLKIDGEEYLALPLIGYKQSVSMGEQGEIEEQILQEEDVTPQNYKIFPMPEISFSGGLRAALTPLIGFNTEKPIKDDANPSKNMVSLGFTLQKGCYATITLREFIKSRDLIKAGF